MLVRTGGGWYIRSKNSGKKLSKVYSTKKDAIERLHEIEYFKHVHKSADLGIGQDINKGTEDDDLELVECFDGDLVDDACENYDAELDDDGLLSAL